MASNMSAKLKDFNYNFSYNDFKVFLYLFCHQIMTDD